MSTRVFGHVHKVADKPSRGLGPSPTYYGACVRFFKHRLSLSTKQKEAARRKDLRGLKPKLNEKLKKQTNKQTRNEKLRTFL